MGAAPLAPAPPLPLALAWVLQWAPLRHYDAWAVAALVGGDLATRGVDAPAGRAAQGVDPPDAALRAHVVAVLAQRVLHLGGQARLEEGHVGPATVDPSRSEERMVGKACVGTQIFRQSPYH